ncbi:10867_t:CDS:1, partial [Scutellospora calospora]
SSNKNCEVIKINGQDALETIKEFADKNVSSSRDLGVRFNEALSSLALQLGDWVFAEESGQFTKRPNLPESPNITYTLSCSGKHRTIVRGWSINYIGNDFTDTKSYFDQNCLPTQFEKTKLTKESPKAAVFNLSSEFQGQLIHNPGGSIKFYKVHDIGVAVIGT